MIIAAFFGNSVMTVYASSDDYKDSVAAECNSQVDSETINQIMCDAGLPAEDGMELKDVKLSEGILTLQTVKETELSSSVSQYTLNYTVSAYDPVGATYYGSLYNAQFIVYVNHAYVGGVTFRKPVYYTQQITWFDSGLGNPSSMTSSARFVGTWGAAGSLGTYGLRTASPLTTYGTASGTRYTGITEYYSLNLVNSCYFNISVLRNVKGGSQITLSDSFCLWSGS